MLMNHMTQIYLLCTHFILLKQSQKTLINLIYFLNVFFILANKNNYLLYVSSNVQKQQLNMRHFRVQEQSSEPDHLGKISFHKSLTKTLEKTLKLLPFAQFTVNYGYAIQNVWVTMLMIVHKTPSWLDSFVWILPVILAAFLRPYITRYIHQINLKVYRQINITSFSLIIGGLGCFIVGLSCDISKRSKGSLFSQVFFRLITCTIGWIFMDVGFQFCLYFAQKIKESFDGLQEKGEKQQEKQQKNSLFTQQNFAFYGLLVGYIVSALICWVIQGKSIKAFYRCAKYAYYTAGLLAGITGLRLYIEGKLNLPQRSQEPSENVEKESIFIFVPKIDFYLPGYRELLSSNSYTFSLLAIHFIIVFLNDIILIYTTMWFSDLKGSTFSTQGEAYIYGLQVGSLTLLLYTIIDNLKIKSSAFSNEYFMQFFFVIIAVIFIATSYHYGFLTFALLIPSVAVLNHFYRRNIFMPQSENNPLFERCIEVTERIQKIIVLSIFPAIVLLILKRDDIPDSLIWSSALSILALCVFLVSKLVNSGLSNKIESIKVQKIQ